MIKSLIKDLKTCYPKGPGGAVALWKILLQAGLDRAEALRLAQALDPKGAMGAERMRSYADRQPSPEESQAVLQLLANPQALAALRGLAQNPPQLALALGESLLSEPGPPPLAPTLPIAGFRPPAQAGVYLVCGLSFREGWRLGILLGEHLAHHHGLEGVFLGARSQAGASRLARMLGERWDGLSERSGHLPHLPGESEHWIEGPGASLQGAFVAGLIDHALRAVLPVPEAPLRLALLARKVTVLALPEDPLLFAALATWIEWTQALSRPVVLVAPQIPHYLMDDLARSAGCPEVPTPVEPYLLYLGAGGAHSWSLQRSRPPGPLRVASPQPDDAGWLFATRTRAVEAYRELTRGAPRLRQPFVHREVGGRKVVLLHGGIPLGERRKREQAEPEMLIGSWSSAAEGFSGERVYVEDPTPAELTALRLSCPEVKVGFSPKAPRFYPEAIFQLAQQMVLSGKTPDPFQEPEIREWWNQGYQTGRRHTVPPSRWPSAHNLEAKLRRGAESALLLPPSGLLDSAYQLEPVARRRPDLLKQQEWVYYISNPIPRETGVR